ncbi:MAG: hemerythrin domain-containing protein [Planctomycetes bacterium]|nr:hemerythrin domain-containing protein [Planctomycetota bacterium]
MTIHVHERESSNAHLRLTDVLRGEHEHVARGLGCLARLAEQLRVSAEVHPDAVSALLDFLREYADHFHHHKEEALLFPWMERHGMPADAGPLAMMKQEHEEGRDHLRHLLAAARHLQLDAGVRREFVARAEQYCALLYAHIDKENHILYPMADRMGSSTRELYQAPSVEDEKQEQHWEDVVDHLENEARHWPKPRIVPRPGCCGTCG